MPEDEAPAIEQETPDATEQSGPSVEETPAAESTTDEAPATDAYEKRYNDLRSDYDRRNARYSQYETFIENLTNPETQGEALRALGLELEDLEADEDDPDPNDRIEQLEQYLSEQAEHAAEREAFELEDRLVAQELDKYASDLSDEEKEIVATLADQIRDEDDIPNVEAAVKAYQKASEANQKRYVESKRAPKVGVGTAGTEKVDLSNDDARQQLMADMLEADRQA